MPYKRVLTVQDISCVGHCSLGVALPILSAAGYEACPLPTAILSTHTGFPQKPSIHDLTGQMPQIIGHWERENLTFDACYVGYLGSTLQVGIVKGLLQKSAAPGFVGIVDPVMGDNGKLYHGFDEEYIKAMKSLVGSAHIILPNLTEGCLLTGIPYQEELTEGYVREVLGSLAHLGAKTILLTGIGFEKDMTGIMVYEAGREYYVPHRRLERGYFGTGDVFASAFTAGYLKGLPAKDAAALAGEFTVRCMEDTLGDEAHWYGVKFEGQLRYLMDALESKEESRFIDNTCN